jgi:biopolymer transport protein ExbD
MRRRIRHEEETGELNIVPYLDIVVNLVMLMLLSMTGLVSLGVVNVSAPKVGPAAAAAAADQPRLLLTIGISRRGFFVGGETPGARAQEALSAAAPTIPLAAGGAYDYAALTERMKRVKDRFPTETNVILTAEPDVSYDVLIQTMDACREAKATSSDGTPERRPLFFDVSLSLTS